MATAQDEKGAGGRVVLLTALVALSVTSAAGFGRVFQGRQATVKLMVAAGIAAALAGALERRHILLAAAVSAFGLALAVALLVFPDTSRFGLPTMATWRAATAAIRAVGHVAQVQVAPALPLPPLLLAGLTAVWTAAFAAHALAVRARSPFLALLPLAALLAFAGVLVEDGSRPAYTVTFLAASLVLLFADSFRRVGHWGPVSVWHGRSRLQVGSVTTTRTARRVAMASLAVAAFAPGLLPGFGSKGLLEVHGGADAQFVSIDPIVDIRPALIDNTPVDLFRVQSTEASYWRFLALDTFDGRVWKSSNLDASGGRFIASDALSPNTDEQSLLGTSNAAEVQQTFQFQRLTQPWLPAAYDPIAVSVSGSTVRYDPEAQVLVASNGTYKGFAYNVDSVVVVPTPDELDAESIPAGPAVRRYTALPSDTPRQIRAIAHDLTDSQPDMYRKVLAIQDYLQGFSYDIRVPAGHDVNQILYFLTRSKRGYCEQFAGSMAVLLRSLGIPARVAVGFTPGTFDPRTETYQVTSQNAHAWVEVLFPRFGWLAFEPTPTRTNPVGQPYIAPNAAILPRGCVNESLPNCRDANRTKKSNQQSGSLHRIGKDSEGLPLPGTGGDFRFNPPPSSLGRWRNRALLAVLGLLALAGLAIPVAKSARRRVVLARAHAPEERVLASYQVMSDRARDLGMGRRSHETPREYRARLRARVPSLDGSLDLLTTLATTAAYAGGEVSPDQSERAFASSRRVIREIRRAAKPAARVAGWFRVERFALPR